MQKKYRRQSILFPQQSHNELIHALTAMLIAAQENGTLVGFDF